MLSKLNTVVKGFLLGFGAVGIATYFLVLIAMFIGYFANIWKLVWMAFTGNAADQIFILILRIAGIFVTPLGGVIGWF